MGKKAKRQPQEVRAQKSPKQTSSNNLILYGAGVVVVALLCAWVFTAGNIDTNNTTHTRQKRSLLSIERVGDDHELAKYRSLWGKQKPIVIVGVPPSVLFGWGRVAWNMGLHMKSNGYYPIFTNTPHSIPDDVEHRKTILKLQKDQAALVAELKEMDEWPFPAIYPGPGADEPEMKGTENICYLTFEETRLQNEEKHWIGACEHVVTSSNWNKELIVNNTDRKAEDVQVWHQGVDAIDNKDLWAEDLSPDRFIVYSGGKFEYRKAQDIVVAAFKRFHERNPTANAHLVTMWKVQEAWARIIETMKCSLYTIGAPTSVEVPAMDEWLIENGLKREQFSNFGYIIPAQQLNILQKADCAVFPNRAEAGTNLIAQEAMMAAVPSILLNSTGQRDLLAMTLDGDPIAFAVQPKRKCSCRGREHETNVSTQLFDSNWEEPDIDDIVVHMEQIYKQKQIGLQLGYRANQHLTALHQWKIRLRQWCANLDTTLTQSSWELW